jgi:hypothetical protein
VRLFKSEQSHQTAPPSVIDRLRALRLMRRAVFGEPLRAHPPEIGWTNAPGNTHLVEHQRHAGYDENSDCEEHGF